MNTHFYIPASGPDKGALQEAIYAASLLAEKNSCGITLVVPVLSSANSTILAEVIDSKQLKKLTKGDTLKLRDIQIKLTSTQKLNFSSAHDVLIGIWAGKNMLKKLDACLNAKAIIAVSWLPDELSDWIEVHSAKCLRNTENA